MNLISSDEFAAKNQRQLNADDCDNISPAREKGTYLTKKISSNNLKKDVLNSVGDTIGLIRFLSQLC